MKRIISFLLIVSVLLSFAAFHASAEDVYCSIRVEISGAGEVTDGQHNTKSKMTQQYLRGERVTLTATPELDEDFTFLYWKNAETKRILSFEPEYSFYAATYQKIEAVFDYNEEGCAKEGVHRVVYLNLGDTVLYTESLDYGDDSYVENIVPDSMLYIDGKKFDGWDHTPAEVASDPSYVIYVRPLYSNVATRMVTTIIDGISTTQTVDYESQITIKCPVSLNGQDFSYWVSRGKDEFHPDEIASYFQNYTFYVVHDETLEAVYGDGGAYGTALRILGDTPDFDNSKITFASEWAATSEYTILQTGIIVTKNIRIGSSPSAFVINSTQSSEILKGTSKSTSRAGTYTLAIKNWFATAGDGTLYYPTLYARAYVVAKDSSGVSHEFYSVIYCADYISQTFSGTIEGDNFDDPYA